MTQPVVTIQGATPFSDPVSWDTIVVNRNTAWFGRFKIKGATRSYKWDIKDAPGLQGATETYRGQTPSPFTIVFSLWTDDHFQKWDVFSLLFRYDGITPGVGVKPIDVFHPQLAKVGIYQVICESIGTPEMVSDDGMFEVEVNLREFYPMIGQNATVTPDAAADKPEGDGEDPVIARLEAQRGQKHQTVINSGVLPLP